MKFLFFRKIRRSVLLFQNLRKYGSFLRGKTSFFEQKLFFNIFKIESIFLKTFDLLREKIFDQLRNAFNGCKRDIFNFFQNNLN